MGAVVQSDLGLDVPVVEVEAGRVAGEHVVGNRVACQVQLAFCGRGDGKFRRQPDLDHDRLRRGLVAGRRHGEVNRVDALVGVGLGGVRLDAAGPVSDVAVGV
jgi:hypothetical protein